MENVLEFIVFGVIAIVIGIGLFNIAAEDPVSAIVILGLGGIGFAIGHFFGTGWSLFGSVMGALTGWAIKSRR